MIQPPDLPIETGSEIPLQLHDTLWLGAQLEYLRWLGSTDDINRQHVSDVLGSIEKKLKVRSGSSILVQQISQYRDNISKEGVSDIEEVEKKATTWINLLSQELKTQKSIPISDAGVLNIESLVDSPESLFGPEVWRWLDQKPQSDIEESCRALAVECPTASVMLSLRAVEHCLRRWYEQENRPLERGGWGQVLDQLMEKHASEEKRNDTVLTQLSDLPPVLSNLYYLKEKRNEVNHPERSPTTQEARRTLIIVSSTISDIYDETYTVETDNEIKVDPRDRDMVPQIEPSSMNKEELMYNIIRNAATYTGESVSRDTIFEIVDEFGLSENEFEEVLEDLMMSGRVYEPRADEIKPI